MIIGEAGGICKAKETVAQDVMNYLDRLAGQAEKTACRVDEKLYGICRQDTPKSEPDSVPDPIQEEREYPPYFIDIREKLRTIDYAFRRVNGVMDRCEI